MKTVIITGASGNLGTAVTKTFLDEGYKVIATVSSERSLKEMKAHPQLESFIVNLESEKETAEFVEKILSSHKSIDAALMLVGGFAMGKLEDTSGEDLKKQFSLNFETAFYLARPLFSQMMKQESGRLVFIGSRPAIKPSDGKNMVAYGLSKSLLFTLADYINAAAKGKNISASVIVPSTIDTPVNRKSMPNANPENWVSPETLAGILEFVVSDKAGALRENVIKVYNNA